MNDQLKSLKEDMEAMGLSENRIGGVQRMSAMARLIGKTAGIELVETTTVAPTAAADDNDPYEGDVVSEELVERLEAMVADLDDGSVLDEEDVDPEAFEALEEQRVAKSDLLVQLFDRLADKQIPEALEGRMGDLLQQLIEKKMVRVVGGRVTRVNKRTGGKAMKLRRLARRTYKKKKAHIKLMAKKAARKGKRKMKSLKTAMKRARMAGKKFVKPGLKKLRSIVAKVKKKVGLMPTQTKAKNESVLVAELRSMLHEDNDAKPSRLRDDIMVQLGDIALHLEALMAESDDSATSLIVDQYESLADDYCDNQLSEGRVDDAAFYKRVAPFVRMVAKCVDELQKNA